MDTAARWPTSNLHLSGVAFLFQTFYYKVMADGNLKKLLLLLVPVIAGLVIVSWWLQRGGTLPQLNLAIIGKKAPSATPSQQLTVSPLFDSQTASINGEVVKIENSKAFVKKKNLTDTFPLSAQFTIYKYVAGSATPTTSTNRADIEPDRTATILLEVVQGEYKMVSITYLPPTK